MEERVDSLVSMDVQLLKRVNLAIQQSRIPVIRDITINNEGQEPLRDLSLHVESEPAFLGPSTIHIEGIEPGSSVGLDRINVAVDQGILRNLAEACWATVTFRLSDAEGKELAFLRKETELLPKDHWPGIEEGAATIAAFVQPNDKAVEFILRDAGEILKKNGISEGFGSYDILGPREVAARVAAIWLAVCNLGINYAYPPASFEEKGQKIRPPHRVVESKLGTCLDLAVLFASAIEQAALHPVIVFKSGHAFAGCWLRGRNFNPFVDDPAVLKNLAKLGELLFFETTLVTFPENNRFDAACAAGLKQLEDNSWFLSVDIHEARVTGVKPLADLLGDGYVDTSPRQESSDIELKTPTISIPDFVQDTDHWQESRSPKTPPKGRVENWKRLLLDLSTRNPLLNLSDRRTKLHLVCPDPALLEDMLADGLELKITPLPLPQYLLSNLSSMTEEEARMVYTKAVEARALEVLRGAGEVIASEREADLNNILTKLYRSANQALAEGGANILYLAIGFLAWRKREQDDRYFLAPLLLVPVQLRRYNMREGFKLSSLADETILNPTLLEMLRQEFKLTFYSLEGDLPTDAHGLDVDRILHTVRSYIKEMPGWEVLESVVLSTFSFSKYLMWRDMVDSESYLRGNKLVNHLIENPREPYPATDCILPDPAKLDCALHPKEVFCPLPTDSSQLSAVVAASNGCDLVIEGPPGTGKSQTIANMIAQFLAQDKTVLFVAEKTAALEVVYRRLLQIGLGEFCLELHSNKAQVKGVLEQLEKAWKCVVEESFVPEQREHIASKIQSQVLNLNQYVEKMHRIHSNGLTVFQAIGEIVGNADVPHVDFGWSGDLCHSREEMEAMRDVAKKMDAIMEQIGDLSGHPLQQIKVRKWSPIWERELGELLDKMEVAFSELHGKALSFAESVGITTPIDWSLLEQLSELAVSLVQMDPEFLGIWIGDSKNTFVSRCNYVIKKLGEYKRCWEELSGNYHHNRFVEVDLEGLKREWREIAGEPAIKKVWKIKTSRDLIKRVKDLTVDNSKPTRVDQDIDLLIKLKRIRSELADFKTFDLPLRFSEDTVETEIDKLERSVEEFGRIELAIKETIGKTRPLGDIRKAMKKALEESSDCSVFIRLSSSYLQELQRSQALLNDLSKLVGTGVDALKSSVDGGSLAGLERLIADWKAHLKQLHDWCSWQELRQKAIQLKLGKLVEEVENNGGRGSSVLKLFTVNYCRWWILWRFHEDEFLSSFISTVHEKNIKELSELYQEFANVTREHLRKRLASRVPHNVNALPQGSRWSILAAELNKKKRHKPLRWLMSTISQEIRTLTPCLMMSPLSIAQYLPAGVERFDVVIIDEASQVATCDAIGALARGKQVVVVGDPKQLPPTSFFQKRERADEDEFWLDEDVEEFESILDECLGCNMPTLRLKWHYRSRHESLITFSNVRYYGGELITFPSCVTEDRAVNFHLVENGVYEKGRRRINRAEAEVVVEKLFELIRQPHFEDSVGIITFNTSQQELIQNLIEEYRRRYPENVIGKHFSEKNHEAVFVKNLESVQGDERDIILFSITYGPDEDGNMSMNFGPLNREGGHRRLNVAITRARKEIHVFSSFEPSMIDLTRTRSEGVKDLKRFLEFSQKGKRLLSAAFTHEGEGSGLAMHNSFEKAVAEALRKKGWTVHENVGSSAFKIDIAVVHPDHPNRYLAGISTDGINYKRPPTVRDRDVVKSDVLKGLGWNIVRVWAASWWIDQERSVSELHQKLVSILEESRRREKKEEKERARILEETKEKEKDQACTEDLQKGEGFKDEPSFTHFESGDTHSYRSYGGEEIEKIEEPDISETLPMGEVIVTYEEADLSEYEGKFLQTDLQDPAKRGVVKDIVHKIVESEAPIEEEVLIKKVATVFGVGRVGTRVKKAISACLEGFHVTIEGQRRFLWRSKGEPEEWSVFRVCTNQQKRHPHQIPVQELRVLAQFVRDRGFCDEEAKREMLRYLNIKKMGKDVRERLSVVDEYICAG